MTKFGSSPIRRPVCIALFVFVFLATASNANGSKSTSRSNRNIYRLGISPIIPSGDDRNRGVTAAEAWIETFSLSKSKRDAPVPTKLLSKQAFAGSMAFLNGVADVFCFRMNKCYANMMTGNTIKMASALGELRFLETFHFASLLLSYALGCTIYRAMVHFHTLQAINSKPHAAARSSASLLILGMFAWSDFLFYTKSGMGAQGWLHVVPLTVGFGLLNAATTDALGGPIAFAMTGHVSKISQGLSDWIFATDPRKRHFRSASKLSALILLGFVLGILGASWLASAGSHHIPVGTSGSTLPSFLVGDNNHLPLFSIVGVMAVILIQFYDRPMPSILCQFLSLLKKTNGRRPLLVVLLT